MTSVVMLLRMRDTDPGSRVKLVTRALLMQISTLKPVMYSSRGLAQVTRAELELTSLRATFEGAMSGAVQKKRKLSLNF